jgi:hypothetical protein
VADAFKQGDKGCRHVGKAQAAQRSVPPGNHDDVQARRQLVAVEAETFPHEPFGPIAHHGRATFAADGQAKSPWFGIAPWKNYNDPLRRKKAAALGIAALEMGPPPEAEGTWETQTAKRFRPLALRRRITARPLWVRIRTKNPWVRFRRIVLGWYVLLLMGSLLAKK